MLTNPGQIQTISSADTEVIAKLDLVSTFQFLCGSQEPHETLVLIPQGASAYTFIVIMIIWFASWLGSTSVSRCSVLIQQDEHRSMEHPVN